MSNVTNQRRSGLQVMGALIGLVKPMLPIMLCAILLGVAGYLCATFLTILAGQTLLVGLEQQGLPGELMELDQNLFGVPGGMGLKEGILPVVPVKTLFVVMAVMAILRGVLHYIEQYCNHYIAFKLLAIIRHKVFAALRKLCPAKLEGRDKGNLISIITTDIELLEVFYAHTISPIAIAILTSGIMVAFLWTYHPAAGVLALAAYLVVGVVIPLANGRKGGPEGMNFRTSFGELNSFVLDSLRGLDETIQYHQGEVRKEEMNGRSRQLADLAKALSNLEGRQLSATNLVILLASFGMLFLMLQFYGQGFIGFHAVVIPTIAMMGSFGPVVALANLSNNLNQTLASGERVLSILEEEPLVEEIPDLGEIGGMETSPARPPMESVDAAVSHVTFAYDQEIILNDCNVTIPGGKILGIRGASGSGKSTLLKLLMRFWETGEGDITVAGQNVNEIPTRKLRNMQSYVTQETELFHDSIAGNIAIGKPGASREEITEAARKASIHQFIQTLPKGYDTEVGELGDTLSGGERQRIGIARAFLHDAPMILLDEPTSNLDSLNEGIILKALQDSAEEKTIVLVSHRKSTMNVADMVYEMDNGRCS